MRQAYRTRAMTGSHEIPQVHEVTIHATYPADAIHAFYEVSRSRMFPSVPTSSVATPTFPGTINS